MEKKKLLLVAVSVGVVLFIIISIPLLMISPRQNPSVRPPVVALAPSPDRFSAIEAPGPVIQPSFGTPSMDSTPSLTDVSDVEQVENSSVTTITVQPPRTVAVPNAPVSQPQRTTTASPAPVRAAPVIPVAPTQKETPKPTVVKPSAEPNKTNNDFWVQTGAFSTQTRAEGAKESLASKGITSIIDNRDIDGKTWYRVRVGPYLSETEASYWLALVKTIDGFRDSQIRQTPATLR
jgi:DedD protein